MSVPLLLQSDLFNEYPFMLSFLSAIWLLSKFQKEILAMLSLYLGQFLGLQLWIQRLFWDYTLTSKNDKTLSESGFV